MKLDSIARRLKNCRVFSPALTTMCMLSLAHLESQGNFLNDIHFYDRKASGRSAHRHNQGHSGSWKCSISSRNLQLSWLMLLDILPCLKVSKKLAPGTLMWFAKHYSRWSCQMENTQFFKVPPKRRNLCCILKEITRMNPTRNMPVHIT